MALRTTTAIVVASIAITLAVIQSDGLRLSVMEAQGNGRIAFKIDISGNSEIYVMDADGSNQVNLTNNPATDSIPSWSPDGSMIAFHADRSQPGEPEIFVMDADGSNQTGLTNNTASDVASSWSPDGSKIAFTSRRDGNCGPLCEEIYVMDADGSNPTRLTINGERDTSPSWSPDGIRITFISTRSLSEDSFLETKTATQ